VCHLVTLMTAQSSMALNEEKVRMCRCGHSFQLHWQGGPCKYNSRPKNAGQHDPPCRQFTEIALVTRPAVNQGDVAPSPSRTLQPLTKSRVPVENLPLVWCGCGHTLQEHKAPSFNDAPRAGPCKTCKKDLVGVQQTLAYHQCQIFIMKVEGQKYGGNTPRLLE